MLACVAAALGAPGAARADDGALAPFTGRVMAYLRIPVEAAPIQQGSASVWLEVSPRLGTSYAHAVGIADAFAVSADGGPSARFRVREAYVGMGNETIDCRIGQQVIPWGNADGINPTDFLGARDLAFFSADPEANRLGVLSGRLTWTPLRSLSFELVANPFTPVTKLLIPSALIPAGVGPIPTITPEARLGDIETGGRITVSGHHWDVSFVGFRGFNHLPDFVLRSVHPDGNIDLALAPHKLLAAGLQASLSAQGWVLRLEGAYVHTENDDAKNPLIEPTHVDGVLGVERSFLDHRLRIQAQGIARVHPRYMTLPTAAPDATGPGAVLALVARANSVLHNYIQPERYAASLRVAYTSSDDKLSVELFALLSVVADPDYLIRPLVGYHFTDAFKMELGAEIYGGPSDTPLGAFAQYRGLFVQGTYLY